jgi:hypothetical protein
MCSQVSWVDGFSLLDLLPEAITGNCQFRMSLLQFFENHSQLIILHNYYYHIGINASAAQ